MPARCFSAVYGSGGFRFCRQAFVKVTHVPDDAGECWMVATDKATADTYRITRPRNFTMWGSDCQFQVSNLTNIGSNTLYVATRRALAILYAAGYRHVHFEYEG
jgi:hypothetical protein